MFKAFRKRKLRSRRQRAISTNSSRQLTRQTTFFTNRLHLVVDNNSSMSVDALSDHVTFFFSVFFKSNLFVGYSMYIVSI